MGRGPPARGLQAGRVRRRLPVRGDPRHRRARVRDHRVLARLGRRRRRDRTLRAGLAAPRPMDAAADRRAAGAVGRDLSRGRCRRFLRDRRRSGRLDPVAPVALAAYSARSARWNSVSTVSSGCQAVTPKLAVMARIAPSNGSHDALARAFRERARAGGGRCRTAAGRTPRRRSGRRGRARAARSPGAPENAASVASPTAWPWVSLMNLKRSTSTITIANGRPRAAGARRARGRSPRRARGGWPGR